MKKGKLPVVIGQRRAGKTTLLRTLEKPISDEIPVVTEEQRRETERILAEIDRMIEP